MKKEIKRLQQTILAQKNNATMEACDAALWNTVVAHQNLPFYTSSGLLFSYTIKRNKHGEYSGELLVSRKEESKTLTRSSILFAFHKVLSEIQVERAADGSGEVLLLPEYKGPKAIGQIFGISYIYSMFWKMGLINVPKKVEEKLKGETKNGQKKD